MVVYGPLQGGVKIRKHFTNVIGELSDGPDLFRIGQAREDVSDLKAVKQYQVPIPSSEELRGPG
jgi:hypothetical protein